MPPELIAACPCALMSRATLPLIRQHPAKPLPSLQCCAMLFLHWAALCPTAPILPLPLGSPYQLAEPAACLLELRGRAKPGVLAERGVGRAASWVPGAPSLSLSPLCCRNPVPCLSAPFLCVSV